jgi:hypothetical protein
VEITLDPSNGGTEIHLIHRGLPGPLEDAYDQGWAIYISRLRRCAEGKAIGEDPLGRRRPHIAASPDPASPRAAAGSFTARPTVRAEKPAVRWAVVKAERAFAEHLARWTSPIAARLLRARRGLTC